ncbi:hypothetical protein GA0116948_1082 [Chitinophaga costaii]|uniref:Outer membrane protein beta-barrel domain-containing protein n=1 Tax=Chitinophaga costaii TaxID=1335309 RepID=A0A1C4EC00_9BACT|nr:hypothetical protein DCM91_14120 [Chitinophaga costaii]SCC41098.1 hypothetical protein GA0116948_1082 [Chitinophaga costaii]
MYVKLLFCLSLLCSGLVQRGVCATLQVDTTAAQTDSVLKTVNAVPDKYYKQVTAKTRQMTATVQQRSLQAVNSMLEKEKKMQAKLSQTDSVAAVRIFKHGIDSLQHLQSLLKSKIPFAGKAMAYDGYIDSLQNSLGFLKQLKQGAGTQKLDGALQSVNGLQDQFQAADQVKNYLQSQKDFLNTQLSHYSNLAGDLKGINKEAYYYTQQLNEYKELLHDKKKAEAKAVSLLQQLPAYKAFLQKHSQLASLFNLSANGDANLAQSLEGLQTRSAVEQLLSQRLGGGPNASAAVSNQMEAARNQFNELKNKFPNLDNAGEMPNFKPNDMKTKSLLQRLEFGANVQFQKSSLYFPTTGDFAGQVAYKFTKKGSIGLGVAYKLGMGSGFNHIRFNSQGVGLRSFMDWQMKGSIYANGGFEENYNNNFGSVAELRRFKAWTGSALLGVSKKYQLNAKMKGNIMLLYDFLWSVHTPTTQPVVLRMGYTF